MWVSRDAAQHFSGANNLRRLGSDRDGLPCLDLHFTFEPRLRSDQSATSFNTVATRIIRSGKAGLTIAKNRKVRLLIQ
jgi:hypothetical protein